MIEARGTPAQLEIDLLGADELRQFSEILLRAQQWLTANDALPWSILRPLNEAVKEAVR